jgi:uncharacterized ferredoxin-like protein
MEKEIQTIAGMMAVAARTAPKAKGEDFVEIKVISGGDVTRLADKMHQYGEKYGKPNFDRDGNNVAHSKAVLLLSLKDSSTLGLNCGACGFDTCPELEEALRDGPEFRGPLCAWRLVDLGIALGSAVKTASLFNADNRIMYRIGVVALREKMIEGEIAIGVPLSATGKSIYFDR